MVLWFLAAASSGGSQTIDLGPALQQIGIGVLIVAPIALLAWFLWKRNDRLSTEMGALQELRVEDQKAQTARERELVERLGPLLSEAVKILAAAPDQFDRALNQAQTAIQRNELDNLVRRVESEIAGIAKEHGR